jgi:hypothetical protein
MIEHNAEDLTGDSRSNLQRYWENGAGADLLTRRNQDQKVTVPLFEPEPLNLPRFEP